MKSDLFVCHASEDGASIAKHLVAKLEGHGLRCWIAPRDIAPGSSWQNAIVAAIEASRAVLLVITPCSNSSPEVEKEITLAAHLNKVIFPVRAAEVALSGALLYQIQGRQWRDLFGNNEQVVEEIAEQIAELRDGHGAVDSQKIAKINVPLNLKQSSGNSVKPRAQRFMSADGGRPSIAVLPFKNMTGDPTQEYFADGLVEDIISALSRIHSIVVIARSSSFTYKGRSVGSQQVGRELGVRYALEGSVRKSADRIRVTGHLDDTETTGQI